MRFRSVILVLLASAALSAQERTWTLSGPTSGPGIVPDTIDTIGDINGDGQPDLLAGIALDYTGPNERGVLRVLSGRDGSTILERASTIGLRSIGDMDQDGLRDYVTSGLGRPGMFQERSLEVRSLATGNVLWRVFGSAVHNFGFLGFDTTLMAGDLDLDGDGRPDLVAITSDPAESDVYAYNNAGTLLYRLPVLQYGWIANNVTAMPDLDGDGGDDFLVGCIEPSGRGAVVVVSGRTGALLRISYGLLPGDYLGGAVCNAGDVDGDGMVDYASASYFASPLLSVVIFSGRTGAVIRSRNDVFTNSGGMVGNVDVDLDGVPDLVVGCACWAPGQGIFGQVHAYSGRDGSELWSLDGTASNDGIWAWPLISLGPQPGSRYPIFACLERSWQAGNSFDRILAFRADLVGAGPVSGTPCASIGPMPMVGMRLVPGGSRIQVSDAPPGAMAWLAGGPAGQLTFGGAPLPYALDPFGLFGCTAYVAPVVVVPALVGSSGIDRGYAAIDLPWPFLSPTGHAFAAQWLLLDPTTGSYATSARHEFRVH